MKDMPAIEAVLPPQPRDYQGVNWEGLKTLYLREVKRFWKVGMQTVMAPVVTTLLYMLVFVVAIGSGRQMLPAWHYMDYYANAYAENQFLASQNQSEFGERGTGSIVITGEGRGPDGWYYDYAGADTFEVWADVAAHYKLDPDWTSISGYSETLLTDQPDPDTANRFLQVILGNARRMQRLVDSLLDLSRIESGRWQPRMEEVDLRPVIGSVIDDCHEKSVSHRITIEKDLAPDAVVIVADEDAVRQVFLNLVDNALRYTPEGGQIVCRSRETRNAEVIGPLNHRDNQPRIESYCHSQVNISFIDNLIATHLRVEDRELTQSIIHGLKNKRHIGELGAGSFFKRRFVLLTQFGDARHVDFVNGGDVRRSAA